MKTGQILFIVFFINIVSFLIRNDAICQKSDDPAMVEEIGNKLNKYKKDYEEIEKSLNEVKEIDDNLNTNIKKTNDKFENYSKIYFAIIENNENLEKTHDNCVELQIKIDKKIKELQEGGEKEVKKLKLNNKLNSILADYRQMKRKGDLYVKDKNRDSLQILKQGEQFQQLNAKLEGLYTENDEFIKNESDLTVLCDSCQQSKECINKLYIEPGKDIWGIIMKIAIIFAMIFFAVMIYNIIKSKKMLKAVKKPNDTPSI